MMKKTFFLFLLVVLQTASHDSLRCGDLGVYSSYNLNRHEADFRQLGLSPDTVPAVLAGNSRSVTFGLFGDLQLNKKITLRCMLSYTGNSAVIDGDLKKGKIPGRSDTTVLLHNTLNADISSFEITPEIRIRLIGNFMITGGFSAAYRISDEYRLEQTIKTPGIFFPDGSSVQDKTYKEKSVFFQSSIIIGIGYLFYADRNHKFSLSPELKLAYGYSKIDSKFRIDVNSVKLGISVCYDPNPDYQPPMIKEEIIEQPAIITPEIKKDTVPQVVQVTKKDTVAVKEYLENITLTPVNIINGEETKASKFELKQTIEMNVLPVLNYIFFDKGSDELPRRYLQLKQNEAGSFAISSLHNLTTLEKYRNNLNIVGYRLKANPEAKLTLTGCNSGEDEGNDLELSEKRCATVKEYLINNWDISADRIACESRNLPRNASGIKDSLSLTENRRVEISSDNPRITDLLTTTDTMMAYRYDAIRLNIGGADTLTRQWILSLKNGIRTIKTFSGMSPVPSFIDWMPTKEEIRGVSEIHPLVFELTSTDKNGNPVIRNIALRTELEKTIRSNTESNGKTRIENYSLILFDFNSSELTTKHLKIIEYMNERLQSGSKLIIEGHTDITGDSTLNKRLSTERALNTLKAIKKLNPEIDATFMGMGYSNIYDNQLPEGRFYSRTVIVRVIKPER